LSSELAPACTGLAEPAKNAKMYERIVTIPIVTRAYVGGWTVNELGQRTNDYVAGIYTFGSILGTEELSLR
jgi:hypothetical protein